jgi:hypothetical protein
MNNDSNHKDGGAIWKFIKEWPVSKTIIVLVIFVWIMKLNVIQSLDEKFLFSVLLVAVLLEIFQLLLNSFNYQYNPQKNEKEKPRERSCLEKIFWGVLMLISLGGIILLIYYYILSPVGRG